LTTPANDNGNGNVMGPGSITLIVLGTLLVAAVLLAAGLVVVKKYRDGQDDDRKRLVEV